MRSERSFMRHFRAETGTTPLRWLHEQRLLHARRLLEQSDLPVEVVAAAQRLRHRDDPARALRPRRPHHPDGLPALVQRRRRAVTSISIRMRGSDRPHSCIVAAGRDVPNASRSTASTARSRPRYGSR